MNELYALEDLARRIGERFDAAGLTLATAESCTAGLISGVLTMVPGASHWFLGGVVAYANEVKERVLGVPAGVLRGHGAVSEETVRAMALGACRILGTRAAVAVSGVAGPGGGTREKPVGTVCLAVALDGQVLSETRSFAGDRHAIRQATVETALHLIARGLDRLTAKAPEAAETPQ